MNVLVVGPLSGTALHRIHALERLGHDVHAVDPRPALLAGRIGHHWTFRTGALGVSSLVVGNLRRLTGRRTFDVALVDGGELLGPGAVRFLKTVAGRVVNYNLDNPYLDRDGRRWRLVLKALAEYDLIVTPRESSARQAREAGARRVLRVLQSADEVVHRPPEPPVPLRYGVVFVGTWMPERGGFMAELIQRGVPLRIFGPRWSRAPEFPTLSAHAEERWMGDAPYVEAIASARISLALLSRGNKDLHTTRSLEIPAIGSLLCGERTSEHLAMYREGEEAVFWADAEECAKTCLALLAEPSRIAQMAQAGRQRLIRDGNYNEQVLRRILTAATE